MKVIEKDLGMFFPSGVVTSVLIMDGICFLFFLASWALTNFLFCAFFSFMAITIKNLKVGVTYDVVKRRMRPFTSIYGFRSGDWRDIPSMCYISVVLHVTSYSLGRGFAPLSQGIHKAVLLDEESDFREEIGYGEKTEVIASSLELAGLLDCHVYDLTAREEVKLR